ncbi:unnamed protein product [Caenorhabditis nigoni]
MKFVLCFLLLLTISTINCFASVGCLIDSDCKTPGHSCVVGQCLLIRRPVARRKFASSHDCYPECPPHHVCNWGQCLDLYEGI